MQKREVAGTANPALPTRAALPFNSRRTKRCGRRSSSTYLPPLLAASTASAGRPNWHMRGPSCPEARAALNMPKACKEEPVSCERARGAVGDAPTWAGPGPARVTGTLGARLEAHGRQQAARLPAGTAGRSACPGSPPRSAAVTPQRAGRAAGAPAHPRGRGWAP